MTTTETRPRYRIQYFSGGCWRDSLGLFVSIEDAVDHCEFLNMYSSLENRVVRDGSGDVIYQEWAFVPDLLRPNWREDGF